MFLKNKNIIFKIRRSKVTDYAALTNDCDNLIRLMKMVKCLPEFEFFYCILEK